MSGKFAFTCVSALVFAAHAAGAPQDRITQSIDSHFSITIPTAVHPGATEANDRGRVASDVLLGGVTVALRPSAEQQAALDLFLEAQRDPGSADFQNWLTPEQFGERFGVSDGDLAKLAAWFRAQGLVVEQVARGRNWLELSGASGSFERAFQVEIHQFAVNGEKHRAPKTPVKVPVALSGVIAEVRGLSDFKLQPFKTRFYPVNPDYDSSSGSHYLAPDDVATIYGFSSLYASGFDGTGQKIAVVGQTDINLADIQAFRTKFNLPANTPQVQLFGADPGTSSSDLVEAELDLEWTGAVARNSTLIYVNSRNVFTSVQNAINQNLAPVISMSYGGCEQQNSSSIRTLAQQANAQGITWIAASGDTGAAGCESGSAKVATHGLGVTIPASIPEVTGIGGTTFNEGAGNYWAAANTASGASALSYIPETSWNDTVARNELSASGGGVSVFYSKPVWQAGTGVPNDGARDVPDLSFAASPDHDGFLVYAKSALSVVGGTSVPTPVFAGLIGLLNQYLLAKGQIAKAGLGNINPKLYQLAQTAGIFQDVTTGNNIVPCTVGTTNCTTGSLGYSAGVGYDLVTGLGSANMAKLVSGWGSTVASAGTTTFLAATPSTLAQNASTQLTATVKATSGAVIPTGTVTFTSASKTLGTSALTASGTATLTAPGSQFALGPNTITALYNGSTTFGASSGTAVIMVTGSTANSQVVATANPSTVAEVNGTWAITLTLTEEAGQPTKLTTFTIGGTDYSSSIQRFFGSTSISAKGSLSASLRISGVTPLPSTVAFGFGGQDANGRQWTQSVPVTFTAPAAATH